MSNRTPILNLIVLVTAFLVVGCGPSPQGIATRTAAAWTLTPSSTPTPMPTATPTPTRTPTPVPYDLTVSITDANGKSIAGANVVFPESGKDTPVASNDKGQILWTNLQGDAVTLQVSTQGYRGTQKTTTLKRGANTITVALERDPYQILPSEAFQPDQKVLYIEDFEDGLAQGWDGIVRPKWNFEKVEGRGTVLTANVPEGANTFSNAFYRSGDFGDSVWLLDLSAAGARLHLNWHWVSEGPLYIIAYRPGDWLQIHHSLPRGGSQIGEVPVPSVAKGVWQRFAITYFKGAIDVWIDGKLTLGVTDPEPFAKGSLMLAIHSDSTAPISFDNFVVCGLSKPYQPPPK